MTPLPTVPAYNLPVCPEQHRWLIDGLWAAQAVGIVGGEPKCCKSFCVLDMAVAVASGSPCLRRFHVPTKGRVLLFAAEDALHVVRSRLEGICLARNTSLANVDIHVITAASLRLDIAEEREKLKDAVRTYSPKLLVLDPFVRLHRIDENVSGEVAPLLAFLRELQRLYEVAVVVVHHAKKGATKARAGQALRGSSEFHAWGDSNLYLRRTGDTLTLSIEHRAAPSTNGIPLMLVENGDSVALEVADETLKTITKTSAMERITQALAQTSAPTSIAALRETCRMRTQSVSVTLAQLVQNGRVLKTPSGYALANG